MTFAAKRNIKVIFFPVLVAACAGRISLAAVTLYRQRGQRLSLPVDAEIKVALGG
jgi:hypothetical protein